jgi:hypothetical protein
MAFNLQDYETVEDRLARFWEEHPNGRVFTELVSHQDGQYVFKAYIFRDALDQVPWSTGYAEEKETMKGVNSTSACENGETSSLGRALSNAGYSPKGKRPSREEMTKVARVSKPEDPKTAELRKLLAAKFPTADERKSWLEFELGRELPNLNALTENEYNKILELLTKEVN